MIFAILIRRCQLAQEYFVRDNVIFSSYFPVKMLFLSLLVFTNLFLLPIFLHPFNVCRHLIHIGHEPFQPELLPMHSFEGSLYNIALYPSLQKPRSLPQRVYEYLFHTNRSVPDAYFYPNLLRYTRMYIADHDLSPLAQSFLTMYISYFLLTYLSSLVHVYRMSLKPNPDSIDEIRDCAKRWIQSSYIRWMAHTLAWKLLAVIVSHAFYQIAVRIVMQRLFLSYGHYQLHEEAMYSSWNLAKNVQLIYKHEGWSGFFTGIVTRMIYELGI